MEEWQKPETVTLWIVIALGFLVLLLAFIVVLVRVMFKKIIRTKAAESKAKIEHQQSLINATIKTQENERKRIASDLHDALISKLTVLQLKEQSQEQNEESEQLVNECITIARGISHDLSPPLIEFTSLGELVEEILHPWKKHLTVLCRIDNRVEVEHSNDFKIQLTRIVQEIITNMSKHAEAKVLSVYLRQSSNGLALLINDNGKGFEIDTKRKGLGLQNIETRVQYLEGQHKVKSKIGRGTSNIFFFNSIKA